MKARKWADLGKGRASVGKRGLATLRGTKQDRKSEIQVTGFATTRNSRVKNQIIGRNPLDN